MIDRDFIDSILKRGTEAKEKVKSAFPGLSSVQLNWKPSPEKWCIGECLEHLVISDSCYFGDLERIITGDYKMSFWEQYSPFSGIWGRVLKDQLQEQVKRKMKAPKRIRPVSKELGIKIIDRYLKNLERFLEYIAKCRDIDIDRIIINSPTVPIVTYSLRDAFSFLMEHEHRHLNQAIRVKEHEGFPGS